MKKVPQVSEILAARRMINGPSDKLRAVFAPRYRWAPLILKQMRDNNWDHEQVDLTRDRIQFKDLPEGHKLAYKRNLAHLSNLDAIQVDNLAANVSQIITDPNVRECIFRQEWEEVVHVHAYSSIVETLFPQDPMSIYYMYHVAPELAAKNDYIMNQSQQVTLEPTNVNKVKAVVSNIALEGIYFFSGFTVMFAINRDTGTMMGSTSDIQYIQRDELTHLELFSLIFDTLRVENPECFTPTLIEEYQDILRQACNLECTWGHFMIEKGVPGLTEQIITQRIQYLTEQRAKRIGIGGIFPNAQNPIAWVSKYESINGSHQNFFETRPTSYSEAVPTFRSRRKTDSTVVVGRTG